MAEDDIYTSDSWSPIIDSPVSSPVNLEDDDDDDDYSASGELLLQEEVEETLDSLLADVDLSQDHGISQLISDLVDEVEIREQNADWGDDYDSWDLWSSDQVNHREQDFWDEPEPEDDDRLELEEFDEDLLKALSVDELVEKLRELHYLCTSLHATNRDLRIQLLPKARKKTRKSQARSGGGGSSGARGGRRKRANPQKVNAEVIDFVTGYGEDEEIEMAIVSSQKMTEIVDRSHERYSLRTKLTPIYYREKLMAAVNTNNSADEAEPDGDDQDNDPDFAAEADDGPLSGQLENGMMGENGEDYRPYYGEESGDESFESHDEEGREETTDSDWEEGRSDDADSETSTRRKSHNSHRPRPKRIKRENFDASSLVCTECGQWFDNQAELENHCLLDHAKEPVECSICAKKFALETFLNTHMAKEHSNSIGQMGRRGRGRPLTAGTRRNPARKPKALRRHKMSCPVCGKKFLQQHLYESHVASHNDEDRKFECPEPGCKKRFKTSYALSGHSQAHVSCPVSCVHCGKEFKNRMSLMSHMNVHRDKQSGPETNLCDICGKTFARRCYLRKHIKMWHLKEKNYKCDLCEKSFVKWDKLQDHKRVHTKEKPYLCAICGKMFTRRDAMNTHIRYIHEKHPPTEAMVRRKFVDEAAREIRRLQREEERAKKAEEERQQAQTEFNELQTTSVDLLVAAAAQAPSTSGDVHVPQVHAPPAPNPRPTPTKRRRGAGSGQSRRGGGNSGGGGGGRGSGQPKRQRGAQRASGLAANSHGLPTQVPLETQIPLDDEYIPQTFTAAFRLPMTSTAAGGQLHSNLYAATAMGAGGSGGPQNMAAAAGFARPHKATNPLQGIFPQFRQGVSATPPPTLHNMTSSPPLQPQPQHGHHGRVSVPHSEGGGGLALHHGGQVLDAAAYNGFQMQLGGGHGVPGVAVSGGPQTSAHNMPPAAAAQLFCNVFDPTGNVNMNQISMNQISMNQFLQQI